VLENTGDPQTLRDQVVALWNKLQQDSNSFQPKASLQ
jgi:hypothetical protein